MTAPLATLREARLRYAPGRPLPMHLNSAAITLSVVASAGFGQLTWLLAARVSPPSEVGLASAFMSGALLCGQVALLGFGSAVISLLPRHRDQPSDLLRTLFTTVALAGFVAAGIYFLISSRLLRELGAFVAEPGAGLVVLAQGVLLPVALLIDQTAIALRRADGVLVRSVVGGVLRVGCIAALALVASSGGVSALTIVLAWVAATVVACFLGNAQLRQALPGTAFRPAFHRAMVRKSLAVGLPNHALTIAMFAPGMIISILVAEVLSPAANAYWYVAWMVAGLVAVIPNSNGLALFAEAANHPTRLRAGIGHCVRTSLALGVPLAVVAALTADLLLPLLGESYRAGSATPLRIMLVAILPITFIETYLATCRAVRRLLEPAITCSLAAVLAILGAAVGARLYGLNGVALAWLAVECALGCWAAVRLRWILKSDVALAEGATTPPASGATTARAFDRLPDTPPQVASRYSPR
jgi:O-antigen/teichoic acid export membrane protein